MLHAWRKVKADVAGTAVEWGDHTLTILLLLAAVVLVVVAFRAPTWAKAGVFAWVVLP